jgi:hypothetical protein
MLESKVPIVADEQIQFLQNYTKKMIHQIQDVAYHQNLKRYKSTSDAPSSAELATEVSVQTVIHILNHGRSVIEGIVATHYEEDFSVKMTLEQIKVVIVNSVEQIKYITKPYLALDESFDFYK